jgi:NAD(P)H-nitrite reductase large subunit
MLNELFTPGPGLYTMPGDETIICRCEEVRLGEVREAVAGGALNANAVKGITRAGMGNCQGRICGELVARIIARESDTPGDYTARLEAAGLFTARPPLFPLPLATLAEAADIA